MRSMKAVGCLLILALMLAMLPVQVLADGSGVITGRMQDCMTQQLTLNEILPDGPTLAPGNHERWIDRIDQLPQFALDFYTWLETNAAVDGALGDPTMGTVIEGESGQLDTYVHRVYSMEGKASFTYSGSGHDAAAQNAVLSDLGNAHNVAVSYISAAYGAFDRDHPEVFWLSGKSLYGYSVPYDYSYFGGKGTVTYEVQIFFYLQDPSFDIRNEPYCDSSALSDAIALQDSRVSEILADCPENDPYEQILYLNKVLTETNAYNSALAVGDDANASCDAWKSISALKGSVGTEGPVCEGYARAMMILCRQLDIPCVLVQGPAKTTSSGTASEHMWNYVLLDGAWYAVDLTWNDPYSFGMPNVADTGMELEKWLFMGADTMVTNDMTFAQSHEEANKTTVNSLNYTNGPVLAKEAYVPSPKPVTPSVTLKYPTLTFEDVIVMNVYFSASDLDDVEEMGLVTYSENVSEGNVDTADAVVPGYTWSEADGFYYATTSGIAAKDLGDEIYFAVYAKLSDGSYYYTRVVSYSPSRYAYASLSTGSASMRSIVVAMLNYGAAAQTYFNYKTDALVNAGLTAEQVALAEAYRADMISAVASPDAAKQGTLVNNGGFSRRYPTVSFEGAFCINYYCVPAAQPVDGITMYYWDRAAFDANEVLTTENATAAIAMTADEATGQYHATVEGIAAKDLDKGVYVSFVYTDGTTTYASGVLTYSIGTYCATQAMGVGATAELAKATAVYGYYANQLFNTISQ